MAKIVVLLAIQHAATANIEFPKMWVCNTTLDQVQFLILET